MSEIKRYATLRFVKDGSAVMTPDPHGGYVKFTDHEAAIEELQQMRRTLHANHEYKDARIAELEAEREQVLADAKARIEGLLENGHNTGSQDWYFNEGLREALAALTQPQTANDSLIDTKDHGGGAATPRGVADALTLTPDEARNLVDAAMGDEHDPQLLDSTVKRIGDEADRQLAEPSPYAKAFRERVCPVPEFPGIQNQQEGQA